MQGAGQKCIEMRQVVIPTGEAFSDEGLSHRHG